MRIEFFEHGGHAGIMFRYHGRDWQQMKGATLVRDCEPGMPCRVLVAIPGRRRSYVKQKRKKLGTDLPLEQEGAMSTRVYHARDRAWMNYRNTGGRWRGWRRGNHFAAR
jgi:hypothetical protein